MRHVVVCYQPGRFNGWPANGGIWRWGQEILVSFNHGVYRYYGYTHNIDQSQPMAIAFARSEDGGESWQFEVMDDLYSRPAQPIPEAGFDFGHPGFALRVGRPAVGISGDTFVVSYDRGHTWQGPYAFPDMGCPLTSRTCYEVRGPQRMDLYASWQDPALAHFSFSDQSFILRTEDGGRTWRKLPNMTDAHARAVMPDVVRTPQGALVAALRRKTDRLLCGQEEARRLRRAGQEPPRQEDNWIEIVRSEDDGANWAFAARAGETARGMGRNGNPPALACLPDGRLALVFGYRGERPSIKARVSADGGFTWGEEIILRDDPLTHDIGYPRLAVRPDGKLVAVYYYTSADMPEQHIEATIFSV